MMLTLLMVFLLVVLLLILRVFLHRPGQHGTPPGPMGVPFLGYLPFLGKYPWVGLNKLRDRYPKLVGLYLGNEYIVILQDYEAVRAAYVEQDEVFRGRPVDGFLLRCFSSGRDGQVHGLLLLEGEKWQATHTFVTNTFKNDLGAYTTKMNRIFVEECDRLVEKFLKEKGSFELDDFLQHASMRAIGRVIFGRPITEVEFQRVAKHDAAFLAQIAGGPLGAWPWMRFMPGPTANAWKNFQYTVEERFRLMEQELDEHLRIGPPEEIRDLMDAYLRHTTGINDSSPAMRDRDDIVTTAAAAFTAGSEATTVTILWSLLYMCAYPHIQRKVQEEIQQVLQADRAVDYNDIEHLPYTAATLFESMRLSGLDPLAVPRATLEETHLLGYRIPKRTKVTANFWAINRNPYYYPDPLAFEPERFIGQDGKVHLPKQFIPFSAGSRMCAGIHVAKNVNFIFFANLLRKLEVRTAKDQQLPPFDEYRLGVSLRPLPFAVQVVSRS